MISAIKINYSQCEKHIECPRPLYYSLNAPEIKSYSIFSRGKNIPFFPHKEKQNKKKKTDFFFFFPQSRPSITPLFNPQGDLI